MATTTRTYKSTDWKLWLYEPVAGKFRLDFSVLNGTDVLGGSTDTGAMTVQDYGINSISISEESTFEQATVFGLPSTNTSIVLQLDTVNAEVLSNFYSGRAMAITLDNESGLVTYGYNAEVTPFFIGSIDQIEVTTNPNDVQHALTIIGNSWVNQLLNTQISVTKSTSSDLSVIQTAISDLQLVGKFPADITVGLAASTHFAENGNESATIGNWAQLVIDANPGYAYTRIDLQDTGIAYLTSTLSKRFSVTGLGNFSNPREIPKEAIFNVELAIVGNDVINAVNLTSSNGSMYVVGDSATASLNNYSVLQKNIDVLNSTELQTIADIHMTFKPRFAVRSIDVLQAYENESITFYYSDTAASPDKKFFYPIYHRQLGLSVLPELTDFGFTGSQAGGFVTGYTHTITKDAWTTNYTLWKGLD